jgi:hypothetical protein
MMINAPASTAPKTDQLALLAARQSQTDPRLNNAQQRVSAEARERMTLEDENVPEATADLASRLGRSTNDERKS